MKKKIPLQPMCLDENNVIKFQGNKVVEYIYNWAASRGLSLVELGQMDFSQGDKEQFIQLLGFPLDSFKVVGFVSDKTFGRAKRKAQQASLFRKQENRGVPNG